jgi:hypothetical protein
VPDLETIVQRMMDANEPEEEIEAVVKEFTRMHPPKPVQQVSNDEPGTFWGGVAKSFAPGGDVDKAVSSSLGGFFKGAIADIPETLWGAVKDAAQVVSHPIQTLKDAPAAFSEGLPALGRQFAETTANAGADPEAFGRMTGQLTGQPLATAGLTKAAPLTRGPIGAVVEGTGRIMRKHAPISGMMPRLVEPRIARIAERGAGGLVEKAGQAIRGKQQPPPTPPPNAGGTLVKEKVPPVEDQFSDILQEIRDESNMEPSVELAPAPYASSGPTPAAQPATRFPNKLGPTKKANAKAPKAEAKTPDSPKVDTNTGEIIEEPPTPRQTRSQGRFSPNIEPVTSVAKTPKERFYELVDKGTNGTITAEELAEAQALNKQLRTTNFEEPATQPRSLMDRVKEKVANLGSDESGEFDMDFWKNRAIEEGVSTERPPTNPLRPEVPEGQVTNQRMLELLDNRAAEERMAAQSSKPSLFRETEIPGASEFSPDLVQYSDDIFEGVSPRFAAPEPAPIPETLPGAEPRSFWQRQKDLFTSEVGELGNDVQNRPKLVKKSGERVASNKPVGPKGESWSIHDPNGKHLGDINVSPADVQEALKTPGFEGISAKQMAEAMFEAKRDELLESHGLTADDLPRMKIETKSAAKKVAKSTAKSAPAEKVDAPIEELQEELPEGAATTSKAAPRERIDPDTAFGPGGNIGAIAKEAEMLDRTSGGDLKFKALLPTSLRYALEPGETFRKRLSNLINTIQEAESPRGEAAAAARAAEREKFIQSVLNPLEEPATNVPLLDLSKVDITKLRPGKINQQPAQWISPRMQQQFPGLARRLKEKK